MLDDISKLATCNICVIASALRVCDNCNFRQPWTKLLALVLLVPPEPEYDPLAGDWAEDMRDEHMNRRPEVGF